MDRSELITVLAAQQWEKCKGELLALVAIYGSETSTSKNERWKSVDVEIDKFINNMEYDILY